MSLSKLNQELRAGHEGFDLPVVLRFKEHELKRPDMAQEREVLVVQVSDIQYWLSVP